MNLSYKISKSSCEKITNLSINDLKDKITNFNKRDFYFFDNDVRFDISSLVIKKLPNIKI